MMVDEEIGLPPFEASDSEWQMEFSGNVGLNGEDLGGDSFCMIRLSQFGEGGSMG